MNYRLSKDFVIPEGTDALAYSNWTVTRAGEWISILIAIDKDNTAELVMPLEAAVRLGLVEPAGP